MKARSLPRLLPALAALLAIVSANPTTLRAQADVIATLDIDGKSASVDDQPQPRSGKNIAVGDGSLVRTGKRTSAMINIIREGQVQLNENSAKLVTRSFFKGAQCFAVRLISGELFINGDNVCFLTNVGAVSGISHSMINIKVDAGNTTITVIEGTAELEGQAQPVMARASEQIVVQADGRYQVNRLSPEAALRTAEWTTRYFNARSAGRNARVAGGILGAIVGALLLREVLDDDDDHRRDNPPPPPPAPTSSDGARGAPAPTDRAPDPTSTPAPDPAQPPAGTTMDSGGLAGSRILRRAPVELRLDSCCIPRRDYGEDRIETTPADCRARGGRLSQTCTRPVN